MTTKTITVLDPTARPTKKELPMAVRPNTLGGKVMGVLWNVKPGGDTLLDRFAELLNERFHFTRILKHTKIIQSYGVAEDVLSEFAAKCDFVITGPGD